MNLALLCSPMLACVWPEIHKILKLSVQLVSSSCLPYLTVRVLMLWLLRMHDLNYSYCLCRVIYLPLQPVSSNCTDTCALKVTIQLIQSP